MDRERERCDKILSTAERGADLRSGEVRVLALGHPVPKANGPSQGIQQQLNASKATLTLNLRERERERERERRSS